MWGLLLLAFLTVANCHDFQTLYTWNFVEYNFPNDSIRDAYLSNGDYIPENNMPLGLQLWEDKVFITVPRWKIGVASNLNYFSKSDKSKSPVLNPYPNLEKNDIKMPDSIVSIFRVRADACNRLWGVDTGIEDLLGNGTVIRSPTLVVIDLKTNEILREYRFKESDQTPNSFFAELVIDVDQKKCENAHAYISDLGGYGMVVYSWSKNDSWRITHNYFHFDPLNGDYNVGKYNFQWTDGLFGMALSSPQENGYRTLYFHAMSAITEYSVSTEVLQDDTSKRYSDYHEFHLEGNKGPRSQGPSSIIDQKTGIDYFAQVQKNGVACWDTSVQLNPESFVLVGQDNTTMVFPNDICIDDNMLYVLSDNLPTFLFDHYERKDINFFVTAAKLDDLTSRCKKKN